MLHFFPASTVFEKAESRVIHPGQSCSGASIRAVELLGATRYVGMGQRSEAAAVHTPTFEWS